MTSLASRTACALIFPFIVHLAGSIGVPSVVSASPPSPRADWASRVRDDLVAREYEAHRNETGLQAPNRAQDLRTYFEPRGVRIVDRTGPRAAELVALRLAAVGRAGVLESAGAGVVTSDRSRVEIRRATLVEWYRNSPAGLEQGFSLPARMAGRAPLVLEVSVEGADVVPHAGAVTFASRAGRRLEYGALAAVDARGAHLPARFETSPAGIRIVVDDRAAKYPVTIDPLLMSSPDTRITSNQAGAELGYSVAGAGDVNGDGFADVIVGAPLYDLGEADEGAAFIFLGGPTVVSQEDVSSAATTLQGNQLGAELGSSVAGAGDVNGDGYSDVIVGAFAFGAGQTGAAFVFLGGPGGVANGDPSTAAASLNPNQADARFGWSVAGAGDVNADGYADVIVGAPGYDSGQTDEGAAFVFLGSASGVANGTPATAAATIQSDQPSAGLGYSVSSAGDVNGDGFADVIVGAYLYDSGETDEGAALVFLGSAGGIHSGNPSSAAALLQSNQASAELGTSVAGAGDVNGDGYSDVIVGASNASNGESEEGVAFVFHGGPAGIASGGPVNAASTLESNQAIAIFGTSVAGAGDVNGDGYADVIVGAQFYSLGQSQEGAAFVFLGSATGVPSGGPSAAAATLQSNQNSAQMGLSVAGTGDVNGDGLDDVIVGAFLFDATQADEGAAFLCLGSSYGIVPSTPATAATTLQSNQASAGLGNTVAGAGDVNGDGYADVIVGASGYDDGETDEGAAFVYLGGPNGLATTPATTLEGNQNTAVFGTSVAGAGDVNGDGYDDVIVGAQFYDVTQTQEGAAFVFLGSPSGIASGGSATASATLRSNQFNAQMGISVAGAGDVNGDGYGDVIVGAFLYDAGQTDEGAAFVFLGSPTGIASGDPTSAATTLQGDQVSARLGFSVAGAGDVNGDGFADVIVGAYQLDANTGGGASHEGAALVFLGSAGGITNGTPVTAASVLDGTQDFENMGYSVAGAGDVNGDGYADVIVGVPLHDTNEFNNDQIGEAVVFTGSATGIASGTALSAWARVPGSNAGDRLGWSVAGAGDVNADGYADVIIGAIGASAGETGEGVALVLQGSPSGLGGGLFNSGVQLQSDQASARLGYSVAGAGDVNGDGFADVVVGADLYDAGQTDEGAAFVFLGNGGKPGRSVVARQLRGNGSGRPVAAWGGSFAADRFQVQSRGQAPAGRARVKIETEYCPAGKPFGSINCGHTVSSTWVDPGATPNGATLTADDMGLSSALYHWRARILRAPFTVTHAGITAPAKPAHGPWHRLLGQAVEADIRTLNPPLAVEFTGDALGFGVEPLSTPAHGSLGFAIVLPSASRAKLELFDIAGRRVLERGLSPAAAGRYTVRIDAAGLPSGIYAVRLAQAGRVAAGRVVMVR